MTTPISRRDLRSAARIDVVVSHSPLHTVYLRLSDSIARRSQGMIRPTGPLVPGRHGFALRPLAASGGRGYVPSAVVPVISQADVSIGEHVAALHDYPEAELLDDLELIGAHTRAWDQAAEAPRKWLREYADAVWAYWPRVEPRWRAARPLIDRETERIGLASVRGGLDVVLNSLSPRLTFTDDRFQFGGHCDIPLAGRRLVLVPSAIAPGKVLINDEHPDLVRVAYAVPGQREGVAGAHEAAAPDRLGLLIGPPRAAILRYLDVPRTMGAIAKHLGVTPAAVTRHCDQLERAGLIVRERRGQSVRASASDRGRSLCSLMD